MVKRLELSRLTEENNPCVKRQALLNPKYFWPRHQDSLEVKVLEIFPNFFKSCFHTKTPFILCVCFSL